MPSIRLTYFLAFLTCCGLLGFASYLQFFLHLEPCLLCIMQRFCFIGLGILFLAISFHNPRKFGRVIYSIVMLLISAFAIYFGSRHIWIQHQPAGTIASCGPNFNFMIRHLPIGDTLRLLFLGSGECSKVQWHFLSINIAEWGLIFSCLFALLILGQLCRSDPRH